jgi:chromosome partitioning protein
MKIIAIVNQKGGVGKTTTVINSGAGLSRLGKRVLLVDLDPQAHLTYSLGIEADPEPYTTYGVLQGGAPLDQVIVERGSLRVVPSTIEASGADMELASVAGKEVLLKEALQGIRGFDFCFLDCPPSLGILTLNALTTAHEVYIPLQTEFLAIQGLGKLIDTIEIVKRRLNRRLDITGVIATRYDGRKRLNREVVQTLRRHFGRRLFRTIIRENISLAEAPSFGKTIYEYRPRSHGAEDYLNLSREIIKRSK